MNKQNEAIKLASYVYVFLNFKVFKWNLNAGFVFLKSELMFVESSSMVDNNVAAASSKLSGMVGFKKFTK
jgi:hypothetical protein